MKCLSVRFLVTLSSVAIMLPSGGPAQLPDRYAEIVLTVEGMT